MSHGGYTLVEKILSVRHLWASSARCCGGVGWGWTRWRGTRALFWPFVKPSYHHLDSEFSCTTPDLLPHATLQFLMNFFPPLVGHLARECGNLPDKCTVLPRGTEQTCTLFQRDDAFKPNVLLPFWQLKGRFNVTSSVLTKHCTTEFRSGIRSINPIILKDISFLVVPLFRSSSLCIRPHSIAHGHSLTKQKKWKTK